MPEVDAEPRYHRYLGEEMKSELAVPLDQRGSGAGRAEPGEPGPRVLHRRARPHAAALAGQAAVAVERARRFEVERLAAIGGLAGDIVHRLNNPVGALSGWVEMLKRKDFYRRAGRALSLRGAVRGRAERDITRAKSIIQELRDRAEASGSHARRSAGRSSRSPRPRRLKQQWSRARECSAAG
jgi:signal transduction histidine kinase